MSSTSSDSKTASKAKHIDVDLTNKTTTDLHLDLLVDKSKLKENYDKKSSSDSSSSHHKSSRKSFKRSSSSSESSKHETYGHSDVLHSLKKNMDEPVDEKINYQNNQPGSKNDASIHIQESKVNQYYMLDEKQKRLKRLEVYSQLMTLKTKHGIKLSKEYTINSDYEEMEFERDYHYNQRNKVNGVNLTKSFLLNGIQAVEFLNDKFNPFKFRLNGWHDHMASNVDDFEEVLGELYEKYKGSGKKMEPEVRIILMILFSGFTFHASQVLSKNIPGLDEAIKNNPSLLGKLQNTVYASMAKDPVVDKQNEVNAKQQEMFKKMQQFKQQNLNSSQKNMQQMRDTVQVPQTVLNQSFPNPIETRPNVENLEDEVQQRQNLYQNPPKQVNIKAPTGQANRDILNKIKIMNSQQIQQNTNSTLINSEADFVSSIKNTQQKPILLTQNMSVNPPQNRSNLFFANQNKQNRLITSETIENTSSDTNISQSVNSTSPSRVSSRRKPKSTDIFIN
jgi:hypothetical protein